MWASSITIFFKYLPLFASLITFANAGFSRRASGEMKSILASLSLIADNIKKSLAKVGINNVRTFTGLTGKSQRKKLIDEWVDNEYEIIIATSAFGVGVDKSDVRTVIHTYIPQNANTYYQELGRGGRDCLPCLSVMCLQPEDTTIGRDRIIKKVLTSEKIIGRWDSLYNNQKSVRLSDNRVFIDTSIKPNYADVDEFDDSPTSDADMNWNVYVLLFLRRHNMIQILEVKIDHGHYMILIKIEDDRLRIVDDELVGESSNSSTSA
jgi:ATP-dependent DNA helicase RecQ